MDSSNGNGYVYVSLFYLSSLDRKMNNDYHTRDKRSIPSQSHHHPQHQHRHPASYESPSSSSPDEVRHYLTPKDYTNANYCLLICIATLLIALIAIVVALVLTNPPPTPIHEVGTNQVDLTYFNDSNAECCSIFSIESIGLALSLNMVGWCNGVLPQCMPLSTPAPQAKFYALNPSLTTPLPPITVSSTSPCYYGNQSAVLANDPTNPYGVPLSWTTQAISWDVFLITNVQQLKVIDPISGALVVQLGLYGCNGVVSRSQAGNPQFIKILTPSSNIPHEVDLS